MNNYNEVLKTAKELREEYKELTIHQSLDIAAKIQQCDVFRDGLMVNGSNPVALEAIAMALGHAPLEEGRQPYPSHQKVFGVLWMKDNDPRIGLPSAWNWGQVF